MSTQFERVIELLDGARGLSPDERERYFDRACGDDADLRREVEAFLSAHEDAGNLMDRPLVDHGVEMLEQARVASPAPERVGRYRILRKIGEGGMSEVYLAIRDDDEFRKRVAVKIVRHDMDREDLLRRFRTERQILAGLDHPNICKVFEVGEENGQPYMAMQWIDGRTLGELLADAKGRGSSVAELPRPVAESGAGESDAAEVGAATSSSSGPANRRELEPVLALMEQVARAISGLLRQLRQLEVAQRLASQQ